MIKALRALFMMLGPLFKGNIKLAKKTGIVVVGVQRSAKYGNCPGATVDAANMTSLLSKYAKPVVLNDAKATKAAVSNALLNAVKNNDLAIFYFSGHGGSDPIGDVSGETDGKNESICLYNTYMLDNEIWNIVRQAKDRVFLIFDCCHSETMFRHPEMSMRAFTGSQNDTESQRINYGLEPRGSGVNLLVWSGCPDNGLSYCYDTGGFLTTTIYKVWRNHPRIATYDQIWKNVVRANILKMQHPKRTLLGHGFGGPAFR